MIESIINVAYYVSTALTLSLLLLPSQYGHRQHKERAPTDPKTSVQILVLGDIGRSPRMQYHALSIARGGGRVEIIGYQESELHPDIASDSRISIVDLPPHPSFLQTSNKLLFLAFGPLKVLFQVVCLWWALCYRTKPSKWLLVQNPPSIPSLAIASASCFLRNTDLIIDWHNFGYSILALKLGPNHPLVQFSKWYEKTFCRYATAHLCVTKAMASVLKTEFMLKAPILSLHDRPARHLQPIEDANAREEFLLSLPEASSMQSLIKSKELRVLVSSTSWTPDEDFSLLIDALCRYSELATTSKPNLPTVLAIITGKGPQKEHYLKQISELEKAGKLQKVTIRTAWLSTSGYASLLASASLGVSLHTSSSGVDLPMKVVDMFGAGLPVVGWNRFEAWPELVTEGVNGRGFGSADELTDQLVDLFGEPGKLEILRAGARKESTRRWEDEWDPVAGKLLGLTS
ncbi:putative beta-1,4-mannosyltransferase [Aspergillus steynii IBT 23096]|uniref:Chitobiosyldiphosphodolichol beta-mannosyltransferase n=1 Tax=Aspergillus steynii IBT 23096 TaxID=1392250 RepID=A0A2I2GAU2_9EURO|nr:putative beta-1,4-mannosyltransferase [Aspergillus steynii IBT 23096]PLB49985.1 putative beta-1,4-mannosyltransferase [Aspergillus steynii IBT 23096]